MRACTILYKGSLFNTFQVKTWKGRCPADAKVHMKKAESIPLYSIFTSLKMDILELLRDSNYKYWNNDSISHRPMLPHHLYTLGLEHRRLIDRNCSRKVACGQHSNSAGLQHMALADYVANRCRRRTVRFASGHSVVVSIGALHMRAPNGRLRTGFHCTLLAEQLQFARLVTLAHKSDAAGTRWRCVRVAGV